MRLSRFNTKCLYIIVTIISFNLSHSFSQNKSDVILDINNAIINNKTIELIDNKLQLRNETVGYNSINFEREPDILFDINPIEVGQYEFECHVTRPNIPKDKVDDILIKMQLDCQRPTKRIVSDARNYNFHNLGVFEIESLNTKLKLWLPKGIQLEKIIVKKHIPVSIPKEAKAYKPKVTPSKNHPRLWVDEESITTIRNNLNSIENNTIWISVKTKALTEFDFSFSPNEEIFYDSELESTVQYKAFYYLMTEDDKIGRESINLLLQYLSVLEYGNVRYGDITRNIGHTIYTASLVYDWCNNLLTTDERDQIYSSLMKLARYMEIGWPPFKENVVNGHASEAQVNRDLLAMSIAIYDIDPIPYKYISFLLFEKLIPMRRFEYESTRHNQGVDYGAYRHMWELNAAWLLYRMSGEKQFDKNIENLPYYWLYMKLPNGQLLRDGDVFRGSKRRLNKKHAWDYPEMFLLAYTYSNNPLFKKEFFSQGGPKSNPILYLLLNDPSLSTNKNLSDLPLTLETGNIIGSMISRTGWDLTESSNDVIAEIKGGGYHFGNHQHSDAGAIQLYYHGFQVCDLGLYSGYGSNYDFNYNKRSIAHSMMLVKDPKEIFGKNLINDGGTIFNQYTPRSPIEVKENKKLNRGSILSSHIVETSKIKYDYYKLDLTNAYSSKIKKYHKTYCFVNTENNDTPAFIVLLDDITTKRAKYEKYWKINSLNKPLISDKEIILNNSDSYGIVGKTHIKNILPTTKNREIAYKNLQDKSFNLITELPTIRTSEEEAHGFHITISPKNKKRKNSFLNVLLFKKENSANINIDYLDSFKHHLIKLLNYYVILPKGFKTISKSFKISITEKTEQKIIITGLKEGDWIVTDDENNTKHYFKILESDASLSFVATKGLYTVEPM